jgi:hypothetical protein
MFRDYLCVSLKDCMNEPVGFGLPRSNHYASLLVVEVLLGWVSNSSEFIKGLAVAPRAAYNLSNWHRSFA